MDMNFDINDYLKPGRGAAAASANPNVGPGRPSAEAQAFRTSQSVPVSENPAPVATATNASKLSFGQRLLSVMRGGGRALGTAAGAAAVGAVGAGTISDAAGKTTTDYEKQLGGLGVEQGKRYGSNGVQLARDLGVRGVGAMVDLGRNALGLIPGLPSFGGGSAPAPTKATTESGDIFPPGTQPATGARAAAAESFIGGSPTELQPGTGLIRNSRGEVTTLNTGAPAQSQGVVARRAAAPAATKAPTLGTEGGIFDNLVSFANDRNQQMLDAAGSARDVNRAVKSATIQKVGIEGENAVSNRIRAHAALETALGAGKKLGYDQAGNPVIVNTKTDRAIQPTINKPLTEADITATMKANKLTRPQVIERLRKEGRLPENFE